MNNLENKNRFVPRQALLPTPQLYDALVGDTMERLARASLALIPSIPSGAVVHDNGCGTGSASAAVADSIIGSNANISIKGTDINEAALQIYQSRARAKGWNAEAVRMDAQKLQFNDSVFSHSIGNALLFALPNDGIEALREMYRTLERDGTLIVNSWANVPTMAPLHAAAKVTRPLGSPLPRQNMDKWSEPDFLLDVVQKGGFRNDKITLTKSHINFYTPDLTRFSTMLWSFVGGTSEAGWLESDEQNWGTAVDVVEEELKKTDGFMPINGGAQLMFVANIVVASK